MTWLIRDLRAVVAQAAGQPFDLQVKMLSVWWPLMDTFGSRLPTLGSICSAAFITTRGRRWYTLSNWCTSREESLARHASWARWPAAPGGSTNQANGGVSHYSWFDVMALLTYVEADAGVGVVTGVDVGVVGGVDVGVVGGVDVGVVGGVLTGVDAGVLGCLLAGVDAGVLAGLDAWVLAGVDAGVLACVDEPWNDDPLDEEDAEDALREADAEPDTPGAPPRPPAVDAADEEVSPAGEGVGVDGFPPVKAITA
jgi:hypothetical protein